MVKEDNKIETHLLAVDEDLLIIPNVAIHMNRRNKLQDIFIILHVILFHY